MRYVDGFVLPLPKKKIGVYCKMAKVAAKVWKDHGALEYKECIGEDLQVKMGLPFTRLAKVKPGETVVFAYVVYKSRSHRDRVLAKVMADPRLESSMGAESMPFEIKRMAYGGFKVLVEA